MNLDSYSLPKEYAASSKLLDCLFSKIIILGKLNTLPALSNKTKV